MDETNKKRYKILMEKNQHKLKSVAWKKDILLNECLENLKEYEVISLEETNDIFQYISDKFPMTSYGRFDWANMKKFTEINNMQEILQIYNTQDYFYVLWDTYDIPCVKCKLNFILSYIDDVLAVGFNTWLLSLNKKEMIEFYHNGDIVWGCIG